MGNNKVEKRYNAEMQQNHPSGNLKGVKENNNESFQKSDKAISLENVKEKTAKISKSQLPPTTPATPVPDFATIAEAVEALKEKREKKKNLNKVASDDIQSERSSDFDLSAIKIG